MPARTVGGQSRFEDRRLARGSAVAIDRRDGRCAIGMALDGDGQLCGVGTARAIRQCVGVRLGERLPGLQGVDYRVGVVDGIGVAAIRVEHQRAVRAGQAGPDRACRAGTGFGPGSHRTDQQIRGAVVHVGVGHIAGRAERDHVAGDRCGVLADRACVVVRDRQIVDRRDVDGAGQHVAVERCGSACVGPADLRVVSVVHHDGVAAVAIGRRVEVGRVVAAAAIGHALDGVLDLCRRGARAEGDDQRCAAGAATDREACRKWRAGKPGDDQFIPGEVGRAQADGDAARAERGQARRGRQVDVVQGRGAGSDQPDLGHAGRVGRIGILGHVANARGATQHRRVVGRRDGDVERARRDQMVVRAVLVRINAVVAVAAGRQRAGPRARVPVVVDHHGHREGAVPVGRSARAARIGVRQPHDDSVDTAVDFGQRAGQYDRQAVAGNDGRAAGPADGRDREARRHRDGGRQDARGLRILVADVDVVERDRATGLGHRERCAVDVRGVVEGRRKHRAVASAHVVAQCREVCRRGRIRVHRRGRHRFRPVSGKVRVLAAVGCRAGEVAQRIAQAVVGYYFDVIALVGIGERSFQRHLQPIQITLHLRSGSTDDQRAFSAVVDAIDGQSRDRMVRLDDDRADVGSGGQWCAAGIGNAYRHLQEVDFASGYVCSVAGAVVDVVGDVEVVDVEAGDGGRYGAAREKERRVGHGATGKRHDRCIVDRHDRQRDRQVCRHVRNAAVAHVPTDA